MDVANHNKELSIFAVNQGKGIVKEEKKRKSKRRDPSGEELSSSSSSSSDGDGGKSSVSDLTARVEEVKSNRTDMPPPST